MKRQRGTLELAGLDAGLPPSRARRVSAYLVGDPGQFLTAEEMMRQFEIADEARLRWLLNVHQDAAMDEKTIAAKVVEFIRPNWDAPEGRLIPGGEALECVRQFAADVKHFTEGRGTGLQWNIVIGEVHKTLSWEAARTGGSLWRTADWRGAFLLRAIELIERYGDRIRQCSRSDCGRLFVAEDRRQKYCSVQCGEIERQRRFRAKHSDWTDYRRRGRQLREKQAQKKKDGSLTKSRKEKNQ